MIKNLLIFGCAVLTVSCASIADNLVEAPRIKSSDELLSRIINECFDGETMTCLKGKVLTYLDSVLSLKEEQARSFDENAIDETIYNRVARILQTNEFKVTLPETFFDNSVISYRPDTGLDVIVPERAIEEARGDHLKKKLLLPVLLLLKLKLKALMPIVLALVSFKALKALILSKLAISIVLGFVIYNLVKKTGLGAPMAMNPMAGEAPMTAYGAPAPTSAPSSSYESSWEPSGGPYSRVWEPSSSSSHNIAYSAYYPSSSSSSSNSASSGSVSSHSSYSS